jgi:hypothetical protein
MIVAIPVGFLAGIFMFDYFYCVSNYSACFLAFLASGTPPDFGLVLVAAVWLWVIAIALYGGGWWLASKAEVIVCGNCGFNSATNSRYCRNCGTALMTTTSQVTTNGSPTSKMKN